MSRPDWIKADKLDALLKSFKLLNESKVLVGVPDSTTERGDDEEEAGQMNNATIGYINEHGSPAANIPARPHLVPGVQDAQDEIAEHLKKAGQAAFDGKKDKVRQELERAGLVAQNSVKDKIENGDFAPLKPSTVAARARARGTKSRRKAEREYLDMIKSGAQAAGMSLEEIQTAAGIKPLVNTAQYRNSITYVVRSK